MIIHLVPQGRLDTIEIVKDGDVLTINGDVIDLSSMPDGATLPAPAIDNKWIVGQIDRIDGAIHINVICPYRERGGHVDTPPSIIDPPDGPVNLPKYLQGEWSYAD